MNKLERQRERRAHEIRIDFHALPEVAAILDRYAQTHGVSRSCVLNSMVRFVDERDPEVIVDDVPEATPKPPG